MKLTNTNSNKVNKAGVIHHLFDIVKEWSIVNNLVL
jgi:hypothetical protein